MPELSDPPDAPEPGAGGNFVKARDLVNQPVILLPLRLETDESKVNKDGSPWEFVTCHYWTLDRSGVVADGEARVSWWRAKAQLRECIGQYVACRPTQQDDNSITLERLSGAAREVAAKAVASLSAPVEDDSQWDEEPGSEPF
jgi:hypothetical protein